MAGRGGAAILPGFSVRGDASRLSGRITALATIPRRWLALRWAAGLDYLAGRHRSALDNRHAGADIRVRTTR